MVDALRVLLDAAQLWEFADRFADEALTVALLRSMGASVFAASCRELGLDELQASRLSTALASPTPAESHAQRPKEGDATQPACTSTCCRPGAHPAARDGSDTEEARGKAAAAGELLVTHRGRAFEPYRFTAGATVGHLKAWLQRQTRVEPADQKLVGWRGGRAAADDARLSALLPLPKKLMLVGAPRDEIDAAAAELERGRRLGRGVRSDLGVPPPPPEPFARGADPRRAARTPINAAHGGGIFLDPLVWAPPRHVRNPRTGRLERLDLSNALHAPAAVPLDPYGPVGRPEHAPINVDLIGAVRGRCLSCANCDGYVRQEQGAANENDLDVLRCARCGCQSHEHEEL